MILLPGDGTVCVGGVAIDLAVISGLVTDRETMGERRETRHDG